MWGLVYLELQGGGDELGPAIIQNSRTILYHYACESVNEEYLVESFQAALARRPGLSDSSGCMIRRHQSCPLLP